MNKKTLQKLAKKFGIRHIIIFGSQTSGRATGQSDFDIGINFIKNSELSSQGYSHLLRGLSLSLSIPIQKIDLTILNRATPLLQFHAYKQSWALFGDKDDILKSRLYAIKRHQDNQKYFQLLKKHLYKNYVA